MGTLRKALHSPVHGSVIGIEVTVGQAVAAGQTLLLLESMKMEVPLEASEPGTVRAIGAAVGDVVAEGASLVELEPGVGPSVAAAAAPPPDPTLPRADLQRLLDRRALLADAARPEAIARRHVTRRAQRTPERCRPAGPGLACSNTAPSRWPLSAAGARSTTCNATRPPTA